MAKRGKREAGMDTWLNYRPTGGLLDADAHTQAKHIANQLRRDHPEEARALDALIGQMHAFVPDLVRDSMSALSGDLAAAQRCAGVFAILPIPALSTAHAPRPKGKTKASKKHHHPMSREADEALALVAAARMTTSFDAETCVAMVSGLVRGAQRSRALLALALNARECGLGLGLLGNLGQPGQLGGGFEIPLFEIPDVRGMDRELLQCMQSMAQGFVRPGGSPPAYELSSIMPADACPGARVRLTGTNFGKSGQVVFQRQGGGVVVVSAKTWTDTMIEVEVPADAVGGLVSLKIVYASFNVCGHLLQLVARGASSAYFTGGLPDVISFTADVTAASVGSTIHVAWLIRPASAVVTITVTDGSGASVAHGPVVPVLGGGTMTLTLPDLPGGMVSVVLEATTPCGTLPFPRRLNIYIIATYRVALHAVPEITQATQFFRALEVPLLPPQTDFDNAIELVKWKPTVVRVYVLGERAIASGYLTGLHVELRGFLGENELPESPLRTTVHRLLEESRSIGGMGATVGDTHRATPEASANFDLPPSWTTLERLTLRARLVPDALASAKVDPNNNLAFLSGVTFRTAHALRVVVVRINLTHSEIRLDAPGFDACLVTLDGAVRGLPTHAIDVAGVVEVSLDVDTRTEAGLNAAFNALKAVASDWSDSVDAIFCGVLPENTPLPRLPSGVGWIAGLGSAWCQTGVSHGACGAALFVVRAVDVAAHELGHALGRKHTFQDDAFPHYPGTDYSIDPAFNRPLAPNGIGQWGMNTGLRLAVNGFEHPVYGPWFAGDLMSYRTPTWVSPHTYRAFLAIFTADAFEVWPPWKHFFGTADDPHFVLTIRVYLPARTAEIISVVAAQGRPQPPLRVDLDDRRRLASRSPGSLSDLHLAVLGDQDQVLVAMPLGIDDDSARDTMTMLLAAPRPSGAKHVVVRDGTRELARCTQTGTDPKVANVRAGIEGGELRITWSGPAGDDLHYDVWISTGNQSHRRIAKALRSTQYRVALSKLSASGDVRIRVSAVTSFAIASIDSEPITLPTRRGVFIPLFEPQEAIVLADVPGELGVMAIDGNGRTMENETIRWILEDRRLGVGGRLPTGLPAGRRRLRFEADGVEPLEVEVWVVTRSPEKVRSNQ